jgi:AcrR family transcriptional regulator
MKEIAAEIGVSSGLLHYYFGTKEDLLAAVVQSLHEQLVAEWRAAMETVEGPLERVSAGMRRASERYASEPGFWNLLFDLYALGLRNPRLRERVRAMTTELVAIVADEVRRVAADVPSPLPVPPEDLALAIAGAIDGVALLSTLIGETGEGAYRALLAMILALVATGLAAAGREVPAELLKGLLDGLPERPPAAG